jgi:hypothetical protein
MSNEKMFNTALVAIGCFISMSIIVIIALAFSNAKTQEQIKEQEKEAFYSKCAIACSPNAVYSIDHGCKCNAIVTVREIQ